MVNLPLSRSGKTCRGVAIEAVKRAGEILLRDFSSEKEVSRKGQGNLVTGTDILVEKSTIEFLKEEYPDFYILSEESASSSVVSGYTWIIDPLDGTNNYVFGVPFFCVNVALVKDEDVLLGITYDPVRRELFVAEKGQGAFLNGSAIQVSQEKLLRESLVGLDLGYSQEQGEELLQVASALWWQVHCLRLIGSASLGLAYVACGRFNLYIHRYLYPWDIASGLSLISEAGGKILDWEGKPSGLFCREIIAGNESLCREFILRYSNSAR